MDLFLGLSFLILLVLGYFFYTHPSQWQDYLRWLPVSAFMIGARAYGMTNEAWQNAFILAGFFTIFILLVLLRHHVVLDRLMLGVNVFFLLGAYGFISGNDAILDWYAASKGGPFFGCIVLVGLLATLFTKHGFIGEIHKNKQEVHYASFLLLAAAVVALIWSVRTDERGLVFSVVIPFILLRVIRDQLVRQMD
jgi:hypothetical protein